MIYFYKKNIPLQIKNLILKMYEKKYFDFNPIFSNIFIFL